MGARRHRPFYVTSHRDALDLNVDTLHKYQTTHMEITSAVKMFLTSRNARYLVMTQATTRRTELMLSQILLPITIWHARS